LLPVIFLLYDEQQLISIHASDHKYALEGLVCKILV